MATEAERKAERDARLDQLQQAVTEYGQKKTKALTDEVTFLKSVINSRTGAGQLSNQGVADSTNLLAESIKQFLEG